MKTICNVNFKEMKSNTTYIVEFTEDVDINTICDFMEKVTSCTKELNNKYIVSSPHFHFKEEN